MQEHTLVQILLIFISTTIEERGCSIRMTEDFEDSSDNYFVDNSGNPIHVPEDRIEIKSTESTLAAPIHGISK